MQHQGFRDIWIGRLCLTWWKYDCWEWGVYKGHYSVSFNVGPIEIEWHKNKSVLPKGRIKW